VQAFDLKPETAIAGSVWRIDTFRNDPLKRGSAGRGVKIPAAPDLVVAVVEGWTDARQQGGEPFFALHQRPRAHVFGSGCRRTGLLFDLLQHVDQLLVARRSALVDFLTS
jgi:hypothetical protein